MAKLTMTVFDIVQQYMMSADRERQIEILADLNLCSTEDIREVLAEAGCMLPEKKRGRKKKMNKSCGITGWSRSCFGFIYVYIRLLSWARRRSEALPKCYKNETITGK